MARQAICISHSTGADGEAVGRAVAERLGHRYVDEEVIAEAAELAHLDPAYVADAERRRPLLARLLGHMAHEASTRATEAPRTAPTDADLRELITDVLRTFGQQGSVVIVAHAASFALADADALRVFITASPEIRVRRVAEEKRLDDREAASVVKEEDAARADYLKRFYAVERELPTHFDLVVSTDRLTPEQAAEVVVSAAG
ncbi:MAG TPA: cytidylate kinase-like family protein [Gaiellaceae bacterium]